MRKSIRVGVIFSEHLLTLPAWSFDFSGYEIEEEHLSSGGKSASFAEGLFKAIVFTRSTSWIKLNTTVPDTEHWREWLRQAESAANQCRTSDDIVEEVPVPRALRRHGYADDGELLACWDCADYWHSMLSNLTCPLSRSLCDLREMITLPVRLL